MPVSSRPGRFRLFLRNRSAAFGLVVLALVLLALALAPWLTPHSPLDMVARPRLWPGQSESQSAGLLLGSDALGRDILAGVLHGGRLSLMVGLCAALLGAALGLGLGATAGYFGGWVDDLIVRIIEIFQTVPSVIVLVVMVALLEPSLWIIILGIGLTSWETMARLARSEFRRLRNMEFVAAARSSGFSNLQIITREILPNAAPTLLVTLSIMIATAILTESALSFIGLSDPNVITLGSMIGAGRELIRTGWYISAIPGFFIFLIVLSLNLIGDGLNDALNTRGTPRGTEGGQA